MSIHQMAMTDNFCGSLDSRPFRRPKTLRSIFLEYELCPDLQLIEFDLVLFYQHSMY